MFITSRDRNTWSVIDEKVTFEIIIVPRHIFERLMNSHYVIANVLTTVLYWKTKDGSFQGSVVKVVRELDYLKSSNLLILTRGVIKLIGKHSKS